jgi:hypothetical protein
MSEANHSVSGSSLSETKRKLLEKIHSGKVRQKVSEPALVRRTNPSRAPLSLTQEQLWLFETGTVARPPLYNESITLRMNWALDLETLERSLAEVIRRHEIWRTSYDLIEGRPIQVVHPAPSRFQVPCLDLRGIPNAERDAEVLRIGLEQAALPFNLKDGPLLRASALTMSNSETWLIMTAHQSIIDGVSVYQVFPAELYAIYKAFSTGLPTPLPELPIQFSDFACWQHEWLSLEEQSKQLDYWKGKLSGEIPVLQWPRDKCRPPNQTFRGSIRSFTLPPNVAAAARGLGRRVGATMFGVLLATFYTLLHHYSGQSDLIVGTLSPAGRKRSEVQGLLGYFLNPVPLRIDLSDDPSFAALLSRVREVSTEAISNDDVPFEHIVEALKPPSDRSRNPYFTTGISLQPPMPESHGAWSITSMDAESGGAKLDLYVAFIDRLEGLHARVQYNPDILDFDQIRQLIEDFRALLERAASHPEMRISQLRLSH